MLGSERPLTASLPPLSPEHTQLLVAELQRLVLVWITARTHPVEQGREILVAPPSPQNGRVTADDLVRHPRARSVPVGFLADLCPQLLRTR